MKFLTALLGLLLALTVNTVSARSLAPIVNYDNLPITTGSGKKLSDTEIQQAIARAAGQREWAITPDGSNKVVAAINVRGKHNVVVDIAWTQETYSIKYKSSINMEHVAQGASPAAQASPLIHPFYNKWVTSLREEIAREFMLR